MFRKQTRDQRLPERHSLLSTRNNHSEFLCKICPHFTSHWRRSHFCVPSKTAFLILVWTAFVGAVFQQLSVFAATTVDYREKSKSEYDAMCYAILALVMVFYPLSGFIADIYCGRFRYVMFSLLMLILSLLLAVIGLILVFLTGKDIHVLHALEPDFFKNVIGIPVFILELVSLPLLIIGLSGYQANFIQLGLDQLQDARSEHLALFVHWANWAYTVLGTVVVWLFALTVCFINQYRFIMETMAIYVSPLILLLFLVVVFCFGLCSRHRFYSIRGQNPYKMVFKVLNYARINKYPRNRSAFTFAIHYMPSRIDFAKEIFGGPFNTEEVEDVKTFLRILVVLLTLGPIHFLQVPASYFVFPLLGFHAGQRADSSSDHCSGEWIVLQTGGLMPIVSAFCFPLYILIVFSFCHRKIPKIFTRLKLGIVVFLIGIICMLVIDVTGHIITPGQNLNGTNCMFQVKIASYANNNSLNVHWAAFILPNILLGIGPLIFETSSLEFISAQSPQNMKGLLVGVYFALKGLFQLLSSLLIIPFSLENFWGKLEHPSVISCGFIYFLVTSLVGLIGLILFFIAAKRYRYRARDTDVRFRQGDVEEIYDRYLSQEAANRNDCLEYTSESSE